jgi:hypothetical protein
MKRLLDQQASLLEYLTSCAAIFGDSDDAFRAQGLHGIDRGLLRLEARFSHEKRMEKIITVFPRTFEILGAKQAPLVQAFVAACPPADIGRLANARQFHHFLSTHWQRMRPEPAYLRDVTACEFACAEVRNFVEAQESEAAAGQQRMPRRRMRRRPTIVLLRCSYDIRSIFEEGAGAFHPAERDTPLAVAMPAGADRARVFELRPVIFDLLTALDAWTEPAELGETSDLEEIIHELTEHGLLEVHG